MSGTLLTDPSGVQGGSSGATKQLTGQ